MSGQGSTRFCAKAWLEKEGRYLIGGGRARLLALVDETGSIQEAAERMEMSYRHAWGILRKLGGDLGSPVVRTQRGGPEGGRTELTGAGRALLERYREGDGELQAFLDGRRWARPALTVDAVILLEGGLALVKRGNPPFEGMFALPGGFVDYGEKTEDAVVREAREETGLECRIMELLGVYSDPERDPRGHTVSVVYLLEAVGGELRAGDDAAAVGVFGLDALPELAFDHGRIVGEFSGRN